MHIKPPVPGRTELGTIAPRTTKNYVADNTIDAITAVPKKHQAAYIDSAGGRFPLEESGLVPKYSKVCNMNLFKAFQTLMATVDGLRQGAGLSHQARAGAGGPAESI